MSHELWANSLFINFNGHVRADASAEGAGGALASILKEDEMVSLLVELFDRRMLSSDRSRHRADSLYTVPYQSQSFPFFFPVKKLFGTQINADFQDHTLL